ncbi:prepilin-type N-terminal cleavage/methylation domain-containing protein [Candidatus Sulfurimonas baltica]|uniref:Prepilin-type N-terminal cleavage/methylation domain-containing protein n=1 Tax=Candidatus Sulfurimonas baltica TaxID=2740404 RepID=A0A7S7RMM1_9BACT|nr:prepilin-type N-terminal cleavage/methylation domain-containing protein [Candidatus Sulfurimonas baltica]QOY51629.1 prepilin-type N-terminal cleavage/methylation domain-containing protein [Candidatus Sulfurimonas baltica]
MRRLGFTLIELIFVIVVMGILSKFGVEFLAQAYNNFIYSSVNNSLQARSATAVESIASRLQFRIKDSIIAREPGANLNNYQALSGSTYDDTATILEWVGSDIEGFRGESLPNWSGIIDLQVSSTSSLNSPETNTTALDTLIGVLSHGSGTGINNSAIYFVGSDSDINNYGWNGAALTDQTTSVMHPIRRSPNPGEEHLLIPTNGATGLDNNFTGVDVFEYYQLAWTAYAVELRDYDPTTQTGNLWLNYDYQPWEGENYIDDGKEFLLMENVSTFRFKAVGSVVKVQVCVGSDIINGNVAGGYSICKEKTIY